MTVQGRLADPEQFENVIVKTGDAGALTRVRDIGRVELGAQSYGQIFKVNDRPAAGIAIFQAPGANALNVQTVRREAHEGARAANFPPGSCSRFRSTPPSSSMRRSRRSTRP